MKRVLVGVLLVVALSSLALAQSARGYYFFAPSQGRFPKDMGGNAFVYYGGGGGKYIAKNGIGIGSDVGVAGPRQGFWGDCVGLWTINGYYQFSVADKKTDPWVTAGFSRTFGHDFGRSWINVGAGFDYWSKERMGFTMSVFDHLREDLIAGKTARMHIWGVRVGFVFK